MGYSISYYKRKALDSLSNNWPIAIFAVIIVGIISTVTSQVGGVFSNLISLIIPYNSGSDFAIMATTLIVFLVTFLLQFVIQGIVQVFGLGSTKLYIDMHDKREPKFETIFSYFPKYIVKAFTAQLMVGLVVFLWSLLLIIPGIIATFNYALVFFIIAENPEIPVGDAMKRSKELMQGHRMEFLWLSLSFLGWVILCIFTCGLGFIALTPYVTAANVAFYKARTGDTGSYNNDSNLNDFEQFKNNFQAQNNFNNNTQNQQSNIPTYTQPTYNQPTNTPSNQFDTNNFTQNNAPTYTAPTTPVAPVAPSMEDESKGMSVEEETKQFNKITTGDEDYHTSSDSYTSEYDDDKNI